MVFEIDQFRNLEWWGYLPLGLIGVWRWSVWCFKKIISFFYQIPQGKYAATVSIITPVYNEDPEMFRLALLSWERNKPKEIIAVIDYTDKKCIAIFEKFCQNFSGGKMIVTKKPGKRSALADGIRIAKGQLVALVDSDTVWEGDLLLKTMGPFADKKVGGVAPRQDVMEVDTVAKKLFRIHIFNRYGNDLIFQAAFGEALSCISGRTGIYRRKAIKNLVDELENEFFLGKKCISGDDKRLTNLIQRDGWKVKYMKNALVYTPGFPNLGTYLKQQIRWTRNSWRSDFVVIPQKWLWKNPFLAFHTIDRFFQPFTLLLGPIFLIIALYKGDWLFAGILLGWWLVSRSIKIAGHLRHHPYDAAIMPIYVFYTYIIAVIKIYTLLTVGEQSWITRWDKDRISKVHVYKKWLSYGATACIVAGLFAGSFYVNVSITGAKSFYEKQRLAKEEKIKKLSKYEGESTVILSTEKQQEKKILELQEKMAQDQFAYYQVGLWETASSIRKRFLLDDQVVVYDEEKEVVEAGEFLQGGKVIAIKASDLQKTQIDYYANLSSSGFVVTQDLAENAIRIKGKNAFVTIPELAQRLNNRLLLEKTADKTWILRKNLYIDNGVTLVVDGSEVEWLKLGSDDRRFSWIKAESGNIIIRNTKITSWDEKQADFDRNYENGRSYILQKSNGRMDVMGSELAYLGYYGYPNRGNPYGGPYGISWKIQNGSFKKELSTGSIKNSRIHDNLFGVYTYGVTGMDISQNEVYDNIQYGLDPHDDSNHMLISDNDVHDNGNHGIITSKRCFANVIRGNHSYNNKLHGIMLDRDSNSNLVENNYTSGNINGIALYHSSENIIRNNQFIDNQIGVRANNFSLDNYFENNIISANKKGVYLYGDTQNNWIIKNNFSNNGLNFHFKDRSSNYRD